LVQVQTEEATVKGFSQLSLAQLPVPEHRPLSDPSAAYEFFDLSQALRPRVPVGLDHGAGQADRTESALAGPLAQSAPQPEGIQLWMDFLLVQGRQNVIKMALGNHFTFAEHNIVGLGLLKPAFG
jgi:hypothetical protein